MTLKMLKTIEAMPNNNYNIAKSMIAGGYSKNSAYSGHTREPVLRCTKRVWQPMGEAEIVREFEKIKRKCEKSKDYSNALRAMEALARIKAMFKDKTQITHNTDITPEEEEILRRRVKEIDKENTPTVTPTV